MVKETHHFYLRILCLINYKKKKIGFGFGQDMLMIHGQNKIRIAITSGPVGVLNQNFTRKFLGR